MSEDGTIHMEAGDDGGLDEEIGIRPCRCCWGEGCDACDNTGVVYP